MSRRLPRVTKGQPIEADHANAIFEVGELISLVGIPPIHVEDNVIRYDGEPPGFWVKITGAPSSTAHPWEEVFPTTGGSWMVGTRSGTTSDDPAYEINGSTATLTNKYARAWRDPVTYEIRFHYSAC